VIYRLFFRLVLQRIDEERAHALALRGLKLATGLPVLRQLLRRTLTPRDPRLEVRALGLTFPSPLVVAAGVDKDAAAFDGLGIIGFGAVEVGTVTAEPQAGNRRPRVYRLQRDRALLNRMGFPNPGAQVVAERLRGREGHTVIGANVGKTATVPIEDATADYCASVRRLAPLCDYLVLNVSSPNTPGLTTMQAEEPLRRLVSAVRHELRASCPGLPTLLKIGPDLSDEEIDTIADLALELEVDGIIAINTTVGRSYLAHSAEEAASYGEGGISGAPLKDRGLTVLKRLRARAGENLVLVSVGGIETPADAWERIRAGATLVQAYTPFVYGGPLWPGRINRGLARLVRDAGGTSIEQFIGTGVSTAVGDGPHSTKNTVLERGPGEVQLAPTVR